MSQENDKRFRIICAVIIVKVVDRSSSKDENFLDFCLNFPNKRRLLRKSLDGHTKFELLFKLSEK